MNRLRICIILISLTSIFSVAPAHAYPDYTNLYVNDFADLLPQEVEDDIHDRLVDLRKSHGIELTVVTIHRRTDYGPATSNEAFATGLFNYWGVGDAARNDGIMILVSKNDREMRIELGSGYPLARNRDAKKIIDKYMLPHFKNGDFPTGISAGVDETIFQFAGIGAGAPKQPLINFAEMSSGDKSFLGWFLSAVFSFPGVGAAVFFFRGHLRNKPRDCHVCGSPTTRLTEEMEDEYLEDAKQLEEMIKSVDYDIWKCISHGHMKIQRYPAWLSKYGACPTCDYKTLESERTTLSHATTSSSGQEQIDYKCLNCGYENTEFRTIPRISKSSSSSGGSFGGGSSSGGGSSGSW